jgi:hypothetical protein
MFLAGIYHSRKVPKERDGRSGEVKESPDYRPYQALWHEIDEEQMYENARQLKQLGFDAETATWKFLLGRQCDFITL